VVSLMTHFGMSLLRRWSSQGVSKTGSMD